MVANSLPVSYTHLDVYKRQAIDRKLLCPFQYFGISDTVDLDGLKWTRGGYDKRELSNVYTLNRAVADKRADNIIRSIIKYVTDLDDVKGLGFCVSVEHAEYMLSLIHILPFTVSSLILYFFKTL